jgi:hypothetical protein
MAFGSLPPQQAAHQVAWVSVAGPAEIAGFFGRFRLKGLAQDQSGLPIDDAERDECIGVALRLAIDPADEYHGWSRSKVRNAKHLCICSGDMRRDGIPSQLAGLLGAS